MCKKTILSILIIILLIPNILFAQTTNDITLKPGFNFVSFTNLITLTPTELKALNASIEDVFLYSPSAGSFLSASEGTLSSLSAGKGYIIKSNASSDIKISITGNAITTINPLNLKTGFNLVGFSQAPASLTFVKLMTDNSILKGFYKWSPTAGTFIQVIRDESGFITKIDGVDPTIKAGESYFINMYADSTLNFDSTNILFTPSTYDIPTPKISLPVISPASGPINSSQKITITCSTEGAQVYYKINEETATLYNGPFTITGDCTIKVTASKIGWTNSDVVTTTFTLNPELEISGTLPSNAINSPRTNINFAASIGSKGNTISVVRSDSENTEIGTVAVSGSTYTANIPINDSAYTAQIIIKDNLGRILFRNILGKTLIKSEIPSTTTKIKIPNINIDATSTAMALLVKEKNISVNKIVSISATDIQNGIATKTSTIANEISEQFSATPNLITEISKAVKTVSSTVLLTNVSTTTVPTSINSATELLSSFVKIVSEPNLQTIISQNQLTTSITLSADEQITSTTTIIEPILKVKMPIVEPLEWSNSLSALQITITSPSVGSTIYYTINGTTPSNSSILYSGPVTITDTTTIKAIAIKSGYTNSDVKSITFNKPSRILSAISTNLLYDYVNTESRYMLSSKDSNIKGKAYYSNNTSAEVSLNWTIKSGSGKLEFDNSTLYFYSSSSPGVTILTGSYTEGGITKTADFTIESKEIVPLYLNLQAVKKTNGDILITWTTSQATSFKSTATIWSNDSIPLVDTIKTETLLTPTTQHSILYTAGSIPASFTHIRITCFDNTITFFTFKNILKENIILKANSAPTISNIILSNSNGDVDIQFNIQDEDNDLCGVSLFYNAKNSASVEIPLNNIIGSTQYLVPGQTHKLKWIINNDLTGIYSTALYIYLIPYDSTNVGKGVSADPFAYTKWKLEKANTNFSPRNNHSSVVYNNKLWVIGGFYGEKLNDIWNTSDGVNWTNVSYDFTGKKYNDYYKCAVLNNKIFIYNGNASNNQQIGIADFNIWSIENNSVKSESIVPEFAKTSAAPKTSLGMSAWYIIDSWEIIQFNNALYAICSYYDNAVSTDNGWLFDHTHNRAYKNMIWRSYDGINWVKISDNLPFKSRKWFSAAVFDNKMWITGGASYTLIGDDVKINTYYNTDAWYSSDGVNWNIATNYTGFSGRILHKTISFDNRLWLIGGFNGTGDETDTWVTSNGVTWNKLTSYNTFGGRDGHACEIFNSKLWVIGGFKDITQTNDVWSIY